ncbi:MAG: VWA domain-containing protein [Flavobacteriales bacterium]
MSKNDIAKLIMVNLTIGMLVLFTVLNYELASPLWLILLLCIPLLSAYYLWKKKGYYGSLNLSSNSAIPVSKLLQIIPDVLKALMLTALALSILALSRPQEQMVPKDISKEGIDIVIALDISSSMLAKDFEPDRLTVAKNVAKQYVKDRPNDRFGIVIYGRESFPLVPLTGDNEMVISAIEQIEFGRLQDGTAIGLGLASAVNRLKDSETKSKTIILLSDGENTRGTLNPIQASELANVYGITIYTVGVGSEGMALMPYTNRNGQILYREKPVSIDERTLYAIAENTGGKYFRAINEQQLAEIYDIIDQLEKTKFEATIIKQKAEAHWKFLAVAIALIMLVFSIRTFFLKSLYS